MNLLLVSVIMPVYNAEKYLKEAIDSILNQTYEDFEFIIINDGSTDRSKEIINSYNDNRIKVLDNKKNQGIVYTLNRGLDACNGKYIIRMDSDDISLPNRIEKQVGFMEAHADIGISAGIIKTFGVNVKKGYLPPITSEEIKCSLLFDSSLAHPAVIMRSDLVSKYNLRYQNYIAEDYMMWVTALEHCKMVIQPEYVLHYRITESNLTSTMNKKECLKRETFMEAYKIMLERCGLYASIEDRTLQYIFNSGILEHNDIKHLKKHLKNIIRANSESEYFNDRVLKRIIGKRWISYIRRSKQYLNLLSIYTLYGVNYVLYRKFKNHEHILGDQL